jgi:hypothetical protein
MKLLLYIYFLIPSDTCRENYLNEILQNSKGVDYFLAVKARRQDKKNTCIVLSCIELLHNLKKESFNTDDSIIVKIKNDEFFLLIDDSSRWFTEAKHYKDVDNAKTKGEKYFIEKYFDKWGYLKHEAPFKYIGHIIEVLFEWNILVKEVEGNIYIDKKRFCDNSPPNLPHELHHATKN